MRDGCFADSCCTEPSVLGLASGPLGGYLQIGDGARSYRRLSIWCCSIPPGANRLQILLSIPIHRTKLAS